MATGNNGQLNSAKHTPGPWKYDEGCDRYDISSVDEYAVARTYSGRPAIECEANARLIAAAPDMLAACEAHAAWSWSENTPNSATFQERMDLCNYAQHMTLVALAKALGSEPPADYQGLLRVYLTGSYRPTLEDCRAVVDRIIGDYRAAIARAEGGAA